MYEVRDYHYRPDLIREYRTWAEAALVVLRAKLDLVGFWIDEGAHPPEIAGSSPVDSPIGAANVTWIIRWKDKAERDATMARAFTGPDWAEVYAKHPDPNGYLQMSSRFMQEM
jgi:hypothetical protein